jgi:hypothetical protein
VDFDSGRAGLSFELRGTTHRWPAKVTDDWVDPTILSRLAELLRGQRCGKRFTYIDLGGQGCLIGCSTAEQ